MDSEQIKSIEQEGWKKWEEDQKTNPNAVNPHAYVYGYKAGRLKSDEQKDKRIAELENLLQQYVWEQEEIFNENKKAADWHNNNVSGVGQTIEYMSYPPLPKMVEEARQLLTKNPV